MNPALLLGGGGLIAYLLLRHRDAAAAALSPGRSPGPVMPSIAMPPTVLLLPGAGSSPFVSPPVIQQPPIRPPLPPVLPTKPPQITTPAPVFTGEVAAAKPLQLTGRWCWPVPRWQGRAPVISDGFGSPRGGTRHMGVDLMFARIASDPFPPNSPNGTKLFVMPDPWPAIAASDGVLWSAQRTPRGYAVVIDHGTVATFYQHLETLMVPETKPPARGTPRQQLPPIRIGQPLGVIGGDPLDPGHLRHLHFELWPAGPQSAIDPQAVMKTWQVFTSQDLDPFLAVARNAAKPKAKTQANQDGLVYVRDYYRRSPGTALAWLS